MLQSLEMIEIVPNIHAYTLSVKEKQIAKIRIIFSNLQFYKEAASVEFDETPCDRI